MYHLTSYQSAIKENTFLFGRRPTDGAVHCFTHDNSLANKTQKMPPRDCHQADILKQGRLHSGALEQEGQMVFISCYLLFVDNGCQKYSANKILRLHQSSEEKGSIVMTVHYKCQKGQWGTFKSSICHWWVTWGIFSPRNKALYWILYYGGNYKLGKKHRKFFLKTADLCVHIVCSPWSGLCGHAAAVLDCTGSMGMTAPQ